MADLNYTISILYPNGNSYPPDAYACGWNTSLEVVPGECDYPGLVSEALRLTLTLAQLNFTLNASDVESFSDQIKLLSLGEYDTLVAALTPTEERINAMRLQPSFPIVAWTSKIWGTGTSRKSADWLQKATGFINVYDVYIWSYALVVYVLVKMLHFVLSHLNGDSTLRYKSPYIISLMVSFFAVFFVGLYRSGLLTQLLLHPENYQFSDFEGLLNLLQTKQVKLSFLKGSAVMDSETTDMRRLKRTFTYNPPVYTQGMGQLKRHEKEIAEGSLVKLSSGDIYAYSQTQNCYIHTVPLPTLGLQRNGLLFSPNVPKSVVDRIDQVIIRNQDAFLAIRNRYWSVIRHRIMWNCSAVQVELSNRLTMRSILGVYFVLLGGFVASGLIVAAELMWVGQG